MALPGRYLSLGFALPKLEGKTHRENSIVIVPVEVSRSDPDSPADGDCQSLPQMDPSDDQARGHEDLSLPTARAVLEMRVVHFDFRPELSIQVVLKSVVPGIRAADRNLIARWQGHAKSTLDIERSEALPVSDRRRDDGVSRSVLVLPRWECRLEKRRQNVLSLFLIRRKNPVLHEEAPIAESIPHRAVVMDNIGGRSNENHFDALGRDQLQPFCAAVVFSCDSTVVGLPKSVEAELFFETRR